MHDGVWWIILADDGVLVTAVSTASAATATAGHTLAGLLGRHILRRTLREVLFVSFVSDVFTLLG
jgi:hypothetical protein